MDNSNKKILLFDLGNTLIYRNRSHFDFDVELILSCIPMCTEDKVKSILESVKKKYPEMYDHSLTSDRFVNIDSEDKFVKEFFEEVFALLNSIEFLNEFINKRQNQIRYLLYPEVLEVISNLSLKYNLGILTNGRPSRRRVLKLLNLDQYLNAELFFISDEIGKAKPYKDIFDYVGKATTGKVIYLIDDEERNIKAAKEANWQAIHITNSKEFNNILNNIN